MKISKPAQRDARQLFRACLVGGILDEARLRHAVALLAEKQPRGYAGILSRLHRLARLEVARRTVKVESAVETSPAQMAEIRSRLEQRYGAGLSVSQIVNPSLIGGLRFQAGSDLYDGSVQTRLEKLKQSF